MTIPILTDSCLTRWPLASLEYDLLVYMLPNRLYSCTLSKLIRSRWNINMVSTDSL